VHGGGALEGEQRGYVSVFLCPEDQPSNCYLLTAHHVVREGHFNRPTDDVQCVSHLDVLRDLAEVIGDRRLDLAQQEIECGNIISRINQKVARITASAMAFDHGFCVLFFGGAVHSSSRGDGGCDGIYELVSTNSPLTSGYCGWLLGYM
jgi:hypothetical protein